MYTRDVPSNFRLLGKESSEENRRVKEECASTNGSMFLITFLGGIVCNIRSWQKTGFPFFVSLF